MSKIEENINKAILDWLISKNYSNAYAIEGLIKDTGLIKDCATTEKILEKNGMLY